MVTVCADFFGSERADVGIQELEEVDSEEEEDEEGGREREDGDEMGGENVAMSADEEEETLTGLGQPVLPGWKKGQQQHRPVARPIGADSLSTGEKVALAVHGNQPRQDRLRNLHL